MTATHGGNLVAIGRAFACDPNTLLDFSASINPSGPPPALSALLRAAAERPEVLAAYPDPHARELTAALAASGGVPDGRVVIANGNAALLDVGVRALATRRCVVPVPAFSEYSRALAAAGAEMIPLPLAPHDEFALDPERLIAVARASGADACIVCNPHNPTGRGEPAATIATLAAELARVGCATIVDEAFVDYAPELSVLSPAYALGERTIVLRSLTKFFALPGLRIGYGFAAEALAERIRALLPSWPVGTLEQQVALAVLADTAYAHAARAGNDLARAALTAELAALGCRVFAPAANFVFFASGALCADAEHLRAALIRKHGIVIRTFAEDPALAGGYVRAAVRRTDENTRLVSALKGEMSR
jgi:threonine-phosphate decarboxylase